jgi:hypothetical protein
MPIVDDYAAMAAELRRLKGERRSEVEVIAEQQRGPRFFPRGARPMFQPRH